MAINNNMLGLLLKAVLTLLLAPAMKAQAQITASATLAELAAEADVIAVVQVTQTDYEKTRSFPSSGWALLKVLVPYRGVARGDVLEVTEKGLGDFRCYYPELGTWQFEGDRFLVFLRRAGEDSFRGRAPGCRIPVLVSDDNRYWVRYPVDNLNIEDEGVIQEVSYVDPAARIDASDFTRARLAALESDYLARRVESDDPLAPPDLIYEYTRGITLSDARRLMKLNP
ncbi:MAG: hypothetical protein AAGA23_13330 [Pseudomonadota bacterium]